MQQNIGMLDRYLRLMCGLVVYGAGAQMKRGSSFAKGAMLTFGAMKIAEGVTGWCPIMYACGVKTNQDGSTSQNVGEQTQGRQTHKAFLSGQSTDNRHHEQDTRQGKPHEQHTVERSHQQHGESRHETHGESNQNRNKSPEHAINESFGTLGSDEPEKTVDTHA